MSNDPQVSGKAGTDQNSAPSDISKQHRAVRPLGAPARITLIREVSRRMLIVLIILLVIGGTLIACNRYIDGFIFSDPLDTVIIGAIGGFVGIQSRLKLLPNRDLYLMQSSWACTILSPLVGGILALLLYVLFVSQMLGGEFFPKFLLDATAKNQNSFFIFFDTHCTYQDYAKLAFWSFLAGFSERFVLNIIKVKSGHAGE